MPHSTKAKPQPKEVKRKEKLSDEDLLDLVQRQTFLFFWDGAQPASGLARDRTGRLTDPADDVVATGGSGFGAMALIVACERGWVTRADALARLSKMLDCLERATCYHGLYPHFMHGDTGATKPFSRKGRRRRSGRERVPVPGPPMRARLFRSRYVRRRNAFVIASPTSGAKPSGIGTLRALEPPSPGTGATPMASR